MKTIIFATALATALTIGPSQIAFAAGGQHGGGGGARSGGGFTGGSGHAAASHMSRTPAPRSGPILGTAVPRPGGRPISPYRHGRGWPYYGAYGAFGLGAYGYGAYDSMDPLWYDVDPSLYPYVPYGDPYTYGVPGADAPPPPLAAVGGLRLDVKPTNASVIVDGYLTGVVDDFNGHFQHLDLVSGAHHVELDAPGYAPLRFDVSIQPRRTTTYHGTLQKS
jgi:hypothetical protein